MGLLKSKLLSTMMALAFLVTIISTVQPALAGKKGKILGAAAVIIGGAILLNQYDKNKKRRKYKHRKVNRAPKHTTFTGPYERNETEHKSVRKMQTALSSLGYYEGNIDGIAGRGTRSAIIEYQKSFEYKATGILTKEQYEELSDIAANENNEYVEASDVPKQ